jgi:hypothetical protein
MTRNATLAAPSPWDVPQLGLNRRTEALFCPERVSTIGQRKRRQQDDAVR